MLKKGDCIEFGEYYKNSSTKKEPIEWLIIAENENEYLLLSKNVIDAMPYDNDYSQRDVMWSTSKIRNWLNTDFFNIAFSSIEKDFIVETYNINKDYDCPLKFGLPPMIAQFAPNTLIFGGENTKDKIFLLSWEDALKYFQKHPNAEEIIKSIKNHYTRLFGFFNIDEVAVALEGLRAQPTPYAKQKEVYTSKNSEGAWWWLRSPGGTRWMTSCTSYGDVISHCGCDANDKTLGVRPALWVKKRPLLIEKERKEKEALLALQTERKNKGLCQHCGGMFIGFFTKKCEKCGKKKDY